MKNSGPIRLAQLIGGFALGGGEVQFVELLKGLPKSYQIKVAALENMGPLREPVFEMGFAPKFFSLNGSFIRPNTLVQIGRLAHWLRENRIEVVHAHDLYTIILAVPAAKIARCKVVAGRLDLMHYHGRARRTALIVSSRAADHVVANAAAVRAMLIDEERIPPQRISLIYNGIDIAAFDARAKQGIQAPLPSTGGSPIALLVANMEHEVKRQEDFLEALALARAQFPSLRGFLVGDGKRRPELEAMASRLGLNGAAHFLGQRRDVPAILTGATMGVLCSSKEGLSNAIMEGMAAHLPMVVTAAGGNSELVEDGKRGFVVAVQRPSELADAMLRLLAKPELGRRMGEAGRAFVESQLSLSRMIEAHDALYQRLARADPVS